MPPRMQLTRRELIEALNTGFPASIGTAEVAALLGISKGALPRLVRDQGFPRPLALSQGNYKLWGSKEVARWMQENNIPFPDLATAE
jgi:predicted DNA-binding transcriptional regulator AlpA